MFKHAIVRRPGASLAAGITSADLGVPDYERALQQHNQYIEVLRGCGVEVIILEADEQYPDSVFVEDTAVLANKIAIITRPGALSRQGEEDSIKKVLQKFYTDIECIDAPGTLEGGDVMRVRNHFYVGISDRTNEEGAGQFAEIINGYGYKVSKVRMEKFLHLKTGLAYLENNYLLTAGEFINRAGFETFNRIVIDDSESYAANCIWVNNVVLVPKGFPKVKMAIESVGYKTLEVEVSEFRKLDGGLSCLSLRF